MEVKERLEIKGVGIATVLGFLSKVGDIRRFKSPKQIQKLAGLAFRENIQESIKDKPVEANEEEG